MIQGIIVNVLKALKDMLARITDVIRNISIVRASMILTTMLCLITLALGVVYIVNFGKDLGIIIDMMASVLCAICTGYIYMYDYIFDGMEYEDDEEE